MNVSFFRDGAAVPGFRMTAALLAVAAALFFAADVRAQNEPVRVERISFAERSDGNGYVVRLHTDRSPAGYLEERLSPTEMQLTIYHARLSDGFQKDQSRGPVADYSAEETAGRVRISFRVSADRPIETDAYKDARSSDLLVSMNYTSEQETQPVRTVNSSNDEQPYVLSKEAQKWKLDCVVIDPGHGGHDPGSHGHGVREKDVVLDVALQLGEYIQEYLDLRVVYTRKTDRFVPLHERGRIANEKCGKLFVSIHANAVGGSSANRVHGTETFILGLHKSEQARRVMERENSVIQLEDNPNRYEDINKEELVVQSLAQNMYMRESEILAERIQDQFANRAMRNSRGVKQAGFLVLWRASMPAVLVELGFVSHPREAGYLSSEDGQAYLASAIFRAIRSYKAEYEKGLNVAAEE